MNKKTKPRKLTIKQRKFIDEVVRSGNATDAAMKVYNCKSREVAKSVGPENLAKPCIKIAIEDRLKIAKDMIYTIALTAEKDDTKLRACQDIIDRGEGKPTQRIETTGSMDMNIDYKSLSLEELIKLSKKIK